MIVTFGFRHDRKHELRNFVDPTHSHLADYIAFLKDLGITQQCWYYYTPKVSAPPGTGPKLVISLSPDDATVWSNFIQHADNPGAPQVVKDAHGTLPVGTSTGPDFRTAWPNQAIYDRETLFTYP